jgi:hypothetical protein
LYRFCCPFVFSGKSRPVINEIKAAFHGGQGIKVSRLSWFYLKKAAWFAVIHFA